MYWLGLASVVACLHGVAMAQCPIEYPKSTLETSLIYTFDDSIISNPNDMVTLQSIAGVIAKISSPVLYRNGDAQYNTWLIDIENKRQISRLIQLILIILMD